MCSFAVSQRMHHLSFACRFWVLFPFLLVWLRFWFGWCEFRAPVSSHELFVEFMYNIMKCTMYQLTETCLQVTWQMATLLIVVCWFFGLDEIPILSNRQTKHRTKAISSIKDDYYQPMVIVCVVSGNHKRVGCVASGRMLIRRKAEYEEHMSVGRKAPTRHVHKRNNIYAFSELCIRFVHMYIRLYANTRTHNK